jgi:hypothetical protein
MVLKNTWWAKERGMLVLRDQGGIIEEVHHDSFPMLMLWMAQILKERSNARDK